MSKELETALDAVGDMNTRTSPEVGDDDELVNELAKATFDTVDSYLIAKAVETIQSQQAEIERLTKQRDHFKDASDLTLEALRREDQLQARVKELEGEMEKIFNHTNNFDKNVGHHLYQCRKIAGEAIYGTEPAPEGE